MVDCRELGTVGRGKSVEIEVAPGADALRLVSSLGRRSPVAEFRVLAGESAAFVCSAPSFIAVLPRLATVGLLRRGSWLTLDRVGHGVAESSSLDSAEQERDLVRQIQAAQANQPGVRK